MSEAKHSPKLSQVGPKNSSEYSKEGAKRSSKIDDEIPVLPS
jgi:hypothetical protein